MIDITFSHFVAALAAAGGLIAFGVLGVFVRRGVVPAAVAAAGLFAAGVGTAAGELPAALAGVGVLVLLAAGGRGLAAVVPRVAAGWGRRPAAARGLAVAALGVALAAAAGAAYDATEDRATEADFAALAELETPPVLIAIDDAGAVTDRGRPVPVARAAAPRTGDAAAAAERKKLAALKAEENAIHVGPAGDDCNCHGYVYAGGQFWVGGAAVEGILADNGYAPVTDPRPGDLAVYRNCGTVSHTAVVRYVTPGQPVLVEGKWGSLGVYLHPVEKSPYGDATYYRSNRPGHLLAGVGGPSSHASR